MQRTVRPAFDRLVQAGAAVVAADLMMWRDGATVPGDPPRQRVVDKPRDFAGFTYGYNHPLFCQSVHDVLTLVRFLRTATVGSHPQPKVVAVAGFGAAGPVVVAARAVSGDAIDRAAASVGGFRFADLADYRHPLFLPGGAKYLDLPGMIALAAPRPPSGSSQTSEAGVPPASAEGFLSTNKKPRGGSPGTCPQKPLAEASGMPRAITIRPRAAFRPPRMLEFDSCSARKRSPNIVA